MLQETTPEKLHDVCRRDGQEYVLSTRSLVCLLQGAKPAHAPTASSARAPQRPEDLEATHHLPVARGN